MRTTQGTPDIISLSARPVLTICLKKSPMKEFTYYVKFHVCQINLFVSLQECEKKITMLTKVRSRRFDKNSTNIPVQHTYKNKIVK